MARDIDIQTIGEAGFDNYLNNPTYMANIVPTQRRYNTVKNMSGGKLSTSTVIEIGLVKIDGKNRRIIINDGVDDRILIGFDAAGF